jgi:predicted alpha/beta hydrolase family esterase
VTDIAGIPYIDAEFDKNGTLQAAVALPARVTDLFVISHGWNNDAEAARSLYQRLFTNFVAVARPDDLPGRRFAIVGVIWPSKEFDELVAIAGAPGGAQGAAGVHAADEGSRKAVEAKLDRMKELFTEAAQRQLLDEARALIPDLDDRASARRLFVEKIRSLLDPSAANREDASDSFFKAGGDELMDNLKVDEEDLDPEVAGTEGSASLPLGVGSTAVAAGGAASVRDVLSGFKAAALNVLNFTTYFEMKARAGAVGKNGVAKLVDQLAPAVDRLHLIGHSFGGRVVAAAAANSTTDKIKSLALLQTAFSHNGFSKSRSGFFRAVVDQQRIHGPILVTHTPNDKAVGIAYPLASRIIGDKAASFGDKTDVFGGLGRNGAQEMQEGEAVVGRLAGHGADYTFAVGRFLNLEASEFIKGHSDVTGREIANAIRRAIR